MNGKIWMVLLATSLMWSCNNEFDLIEDRSSLPVVYGFINLSDTAQYIRVEQSFAEENSNAFKLAQDPDRVFYDNITVQLTNQSTDITYTLTKVDGNDEGYQRDPGDFLIDPNFLYKIRTSEMDFQGGEKVKLSVLGPGDSLITEATTTVLPGVQLVKPTQQLKISFGDRDYTVQFLSEEKVGLIGLYFEILILEADADDPSMIDTATIFWTITEDFESDPGRQFQNVEVSSNQFYQTIKNGLDPDANVIRRLSHINIVVRTSGTETLEYRRIALANQGLTGSLELPLYSNLSDGIGVFSSKSYQKFFDFIVSPVTRDSLANGQITGDLNFVN